MPGVAPYGVPLPSVEIIPDSGLPHAPLPLPRRVPDSTLPIKPPPAAPLLPLAGPGDPGAVNSGKASAQPAAANGAVTQSGLLTLSGPPPAITEPPKEKGRIWKFFHPGQ